MDGLLVIDKPAGWTSHDAVARTRRVLRERRVGHTGTLDPFATGVLVVMVGRATRLAQFLAGADKEYEALVRFGYATDTGDLTGTPRLVAGETARPCPDWSGAEIEAALATLRGPIEQVPPMYSAKKVQGRKLYELARQGVAVERAAVPVVIHELETLPAAGALLRRNADGTCELALRVVCSAGTYVRVLAEDLGARLGTGAHLSALRRTRAGAFDLSAAVTLDALSAAAAAERAPEVLQQLLQPPDAALSELPSLHLTAADARRVSHGAAVRVAPARWPEGALVRLYEPAGALLGVALYDGARGELRPRVMLSGAPEP
ncbi:MAG TPA: tRNA pseudouridine(55) synthase TruB [Pyrinomonadaceae bacterium]|jgi:tRNA pseudouridine55 synthase